MEIPVISTGLAGVLIIFAQILVFGMAAVRVKYRVGVGANDNPDFERVIRRHANFLEFAPLFVVAMSLYEILGGSKSALWSLAALFVAARIAHAIAFSSLKGSHEIKKISAYAVLRAIGGNGSVLLSIVIGVLCIHQAWIALAAVG